MKTALYKGYIGEMDVDFDSNRIHGHVIDINDVVTFHGQTPEEALRAFHDSVDDYLAFCEERDVAPERPYSGKFVVRMTPERHRQAVLAARITGKSLNAWVDDAIAIEAARTTDQGDRPVARAQYYSQQSAYRHHE
jgi:predicted HicB family RNase H-like nuclease